MYKLITTIGIDGEEQEHIIRYNNNNTITAFPVDENNKLYIEYQKWIAEGNTVIDNGGGE
jgi:hypothetical protein